MLKSNVKDHFAPAASHAAIASSPAVWLEADAMRGPGAQGNPVAGCAGHGLAAGKKASEQDRACAGGGLGASNLRRRMGPQVVAAPGHEEAVAVREEAGRGR